MADAIQSSKSQMQQPNEPVSIAMRMKKNREQLVSASQVVNANNSENLYSANPYPVAGQKSPDSQMFNQAAKTTTYSDNS